MLFVTAAELTNTKREIWKAVINMTVSFQSSQKRYNPGGEAENRMASFVAEFFTLHRRKVVLLF